jgi:hypothetical protein
LTVEQLENQLDSFNANQRADALHQLSQMTRDGKISPATKSSEVNLHCHTFFSYNAYGYSPSKFAWFAYKKGLAAAGIVDFDVLDGLNEFLTAGKLLGLKTCVGMETRVYVPEFANKEINSPGEPGIAYHMGVGFPTADLTGENAQFLLELRQTVRQRNESLMQRVNKYLSPVELDYDKDVLPLTPSGNATERHLCKAYVTKAQQVFPNVADLARFWSEKLGIADTDSLKLPEGSPLQNTLRAKTMKRGGVGYVQPSQGSFPRMDRTNEFSLAAGAIPTFTWLDGTSPGEQQIERLLEVAMSTGVAAINIIPDRNFTPGVKDKKLANLYHVVELAQKLNLPVIAGTETNSPGQKFVDDFKSKELAPLLPTFLRGSYICYAHSVLQQQCGLGYTSQWAKHHLPDAAARNKFFANVGQTLNPAHEDSLSGFDNNTTPKKINDTLQRLY